MNRIFRTFAVFSFITIFYFSFSSRATAADKYVFDVPVLKGVSVGSLSKMIGELAKILSKRIGAEISIREMPYSKGEEEKTFLKIVDDMKAGRADFALNNASLQYVKFKDKASAVMAPHFALALNNSVQTTVCAFVRKDSGISSISQLKGKTWGGAHTMQMRQIMSKNDINVPMKSFFGSVKFIDDTIPNAPFDALLAKNIDVYSTVTYLSQMAMGANKKYATGIKEIGCQNYEYTWMFMYRKGTPQPVVDKLRTIMLKSATDKDFAQFKFMLSAIKGKFVEFKPADLKPTEQLVAQIKKYGWEKEEVDFIRAKK